MKIGINLLNFPSKLGGAGYYAYNILENMLKHVGNNKYFIFVPPNSNFEKLDLSKTFKVIRIPVGSQLTRILIEQLVLPLLLYYHRIKVIYSPSVALPYLFIGKKIVTIHDLLFIENPIKYPCLRRNYIRIVTYLSAISSSHVFTVSEKSRNMIYKVYNLPYSKVSVTYNSGSVSYERNKIPTEVPEYKYFIYVGAIEPGKNLELLIDVYSKVKEKYPEIKYLFTTGIGWRVNPILEQIDNKLNDSAVYLGYPDRISLENYIQNSIALIYLSVYEGFGLPVIESIYFGKKPIVPKIPPYIEYCNSDNSILLESLDVEYVVNYLEQCFHGLIDTSVSDDEIKELRKKCDWEKSSSTIIRILNTYD
ncbi:MAG: glycosyltransferase family 4 protein [Bacteroidetes bacterium]|nr:glycosyltransferase family 4 protein [Bacteroidota bacterium]